jgi:hypothetical protein
MSNAVNLPFRGGTSTMKPNLQLKADAYKRRSRAVCTRGLTQRLAI